ncbi:hypothetical protein DFH27DRAFT_310888 [Peziza echinospora]|nr:hypothetical protein DFH27DRAFT_310888 [Peziza echinospora]
MFAITVGGGRPPTYRSSGHRHPRSDPTLVMPEDTSSQPRTPSASSSDDDKHATRGWKGGRATVTPPQRSPASLPTPPATLARPTAGPAVAPPHPAAPTLHITHPPPAHLTPEWLRERTTADTADTAESWCIIPGVPASSFIEYTSRFARDDRRAEGAAEGLRVEYDPLTGDLAVRVMASPVHDVVSRCFTRWTYATIDALGGLADTLQIGAQEFTGFVGVPGLGAAAKKTPDFALVHPSQRFPVFAVEVGFTEDVPKLLADANLLLLGSGGATKYVVLVKVTEAKAVRSARDPGKFSWPRGGVRVGDRTVQAAGVAAVVAQEQRALEAAGGVPPSPSPEPMLAQSLAQHYLAACAAGSLVPPLVGTLSATAYVYVRAVGLAPAARVGPEEGARFPAIRCVREIPFLAAGVPIAEAGTFSLARSDFPGAPPGPPTHGQPPAAAAITFDFTALGAAIVSVLPQFRWTRASARAGRAIARAAAPPLGAARALKRAAAAPLGEDDDDADTNDQSTDGGGDASCSSRTATDGATDGGATTRRKNPARRARIGRTSRASPQVGGGDTLLGWAAWKKQKGEEVLEDEQSADQEEQDEQSDDDEEDDDDYDDDDHNAGTEGRGQAQGRGKARRTVSGEDWVPASRKGRVAQ